MFFLQLPEYTYSRINWEAYSQSSYYYNNNTFVEFLLFILQNFHFPILSSVALMF